MTKRAKSLDRVSQWESVWNNYIERLARLEQLQELGRYGYQLRQPKRALARAIDDMRRLFPDESRGLI
jgi:hypothetical protein